MPHVTTIHRPDNKASDDQQSTTKQTTQPTAHTEKEEDNDSMYDMVREDLVNKTTQLKKVPAAAKCDPSSDYANISTSANNTLEKPKKPEAAVLPPANVYNPETGGAVVENVQYAKIDNYGKED